MGCVRGGHQRILEAIIVQMALRAENYGKGRGEAQRDGKQSGPRRRTASLQAKVERSAVLPQPADARRYLPNVLSKLA
jgi:hypothetical protein